MGVIMFAIKSRVVPTDPPHLYLDNCVCVCVCVCVCEREGGRERDVEEQSPF